MLNELYNDVEYETLLEHIAGQYKGQAVLNRQQTTKLLSIGVSTLDLRISQGRDIPRYIKMGDAKNSRIAFAISSNLSEFLLFLATTKFKQTKTNPKS
jgi:hypothetical protein cdivTM_22090|nr:hypothetical protein [uncultured Campylobacter sp.]